jgi:ABC-2 type transport system ATP-binding protein
MSDGNAGARVIETNGVSKFYGALKAVNSVSISVAKGEIYGFLGLNGAGKTTTIRMLLGMIRPSGGQVFVHGKRIEPGRMGPWDKVGYLVETPHAYPELTVRENIGAVGRLRGLSGTAHLDETIGLLQLKEYANVKERHLSLGNKQRLGLAKALIHKPEILILDEPSNGLDPAGIVEIRELLKDYAFNRGVTVFISSHNLGEISRLATRIGIIHKGALVQEIDADRLESVLRRKLVVDTRDRAGAAAFLSRQGIGSETGEDGMLRIPDPRYCEKPEELNGLLVRAGFPPLYLNAAQEDLETYFLRMIGEAV